VAAGSGTPGRGAPPGVVARRRGRPL